MSVIPAPKSKLPSGPSWEALTLLSPPPRFLAQCTAELSSNLHPDAQAERLADARQEVRLVASEVLLKLLAALGADAVLPRLSRFWTHRSWKVWGCVGDEVVQVGRTVTSTAAGCVSPPARLFTPWEG